MVVQTVRREESVAALLGMANDSESPPWLRWATHRMVELDVTVQEMAPQVEMTDKGLRRVLKPGNVPKAGMIQRLEVVLGDMPAPEKASLTGARGKPDTVWSESTCRACPKTIRRRPSDSNRVYCSRRCQANFERTMPKPEGDLGRFVTGKWLASGQNIADYAKAIGIGRLVLRKLMHEDRVPSDATYQRLKVYFGDELPAVITDDVLRAERARGMSERYRGLMHTPEAIRKSAESRRGLKHSRERIAKGLATRIKTGSHQRFLEEGAKYSKSPQGRAERSLFGSLRYHPGPTTTALRGWAETVGERMGLPVEAVLIIFQKYMQKHGMATTGPGRKTNERRHRLVVEAMERRPVGSGGRAPKRFWPETAQLVDDVEERDSLGDGTWLKQWYKHHCRGGHCSEPALLQRGYN